MSILFRYRETPSARINTEFSLYDGGKYIQPDSWHIGDTVTLTFPVSKVVPDAIVKHPSNGYRIWSSGPDRDFIDIAFRVAERNHSACLQGVGMMIQQSFDVVLESTLQQVEDVFIWVACGEKPSWAKGTK